MSFIINPRTNYKIQIGNSTWKKLTDDEKEQGAKLWKQREEKKKPKNKEKQIIYDDCLICTNNTQVINTLCCSQHICKDCYIKTTVFTCPFCRAPDPIMLSKAETVQKRTNIIKAKNERIREYEMAAFDLHREMIAQIARNIRAQLIE